MGLQISDGSTGLSARVRNQEGTGRLATDARTALRGFYASRDAGLAFNVVSHDATAAAGTHPIYIQNTSTTRRLYIDLMRVGGVASILWKVWSVTGTAAGGSALTPVNLNLTSGVSAEATCRGDDAVTGLTQVSEIATIRHVANSSTDILFDDLLILGTNDAIAVEADAVSSTAIAEILVRMFYEEDS